VTKEPLAWIVIFRPSTDIFEVGVDQRSAQIQRSDNLSGPRLVQLVDRLTGDVDHVSVTDSHQIVIVV
jgi:hypothetical protein